MAPDLSTPQTEEEFISGLFPSHVFASAATPSTPPRTTTTPISTSTLLTTPSVSSTLPSASSSHQAITAALRETHISPPSSSFSREAEDRKDDIARSKKEAVRFKALCQEPPDAATVAARGQLANRTGSIFDAVESDDVESLRALCLLQGADIVKRYNTQGVSVVQQCCLWSAKKCLQLVLGLGANVDAVDSVYLGLTPLMVAAKGEDIEVCRLLVGHGADVRAVDVHGDTCLHHAVRTGNGKLVQEVMREAESVKRGSTKGLLEVKNVKGSSCEDLAKSDTMRAVLQRIRRGERERELKRRTNLKKLKVGVAKIKAARFKPKAKPKGKSKTKPARKPPKAER